MYHNICESCISKTLINSLISLIFMVKYSLAIQLKRCKSLFFVYIGTSLMYRYLYVLLLNRDWEKSLFTGMPFARKMTVIINIHIGHIFLINSCHTCKKIQELIKEINVPAVFSALITEEKLVNLWLVALKASLANLYRYMFNCYQGWCQIIINVDNTMNGQACASSEL